MGSEGWGGFSGSFAKRAIVHVTSGSSSDVPAARPRRDRAPPLPLCRDFGKSFVASLCRAIINGDGSILDPAEVAQSPHESVSRRPLKRRVICPQEPEGRQSRRLRARRERPRGRRAANQPMTPRLLKSRMESPLNVPPSPPSGWRYLTRV